MAADAAHEHNNPTFSKHALGNKDMKAAYKKMKFLQARRYRRFTRDANFELLLWMRRACSRNLSKKHKRHLL